MKFKEFNDEKRPLDRLYFALKERNRLMDSKTLRVLIDYEGSIKAFHSVLKRSKAKYKDILTVKEENQTYYIVKNRKGI